LFFVFACFSFSSMLVFLDVCFLCVCGLSISDLESMDLKFAFWKLCYYCRLFPMIESNARKYMMDVVPGLMYVVSLYLWSGSFPWPLCVSSYNSRRHI
jgi:hypothetical protein